MSDSSFPPAGWLDRDGACRMFGLSRHVWKRWCAEGRVRCGTSVTKPSGGRCKIYPVTELEQLRGDVLARHLMLPEGFVGRGEAMRMFNVTATTWKRWQHAGRVPLGRWANVPGKRPRVRVYALDELIRLRAEFAERGLLPPDAETRQAIRAQRAAEEAALRPPEGMIRRAAACRMFGISGNVWREWHRKGWVRGTKFGPKWYYDAAELARLLAENGRMGPPYPDPQRPGVYRVPIRSSSMRRREVLVDADSLPLIEGRYLNWSCGTNPRSGARFVAVSHATAPFPLRRLIMGVTDPNLYVVHVNGNPLDCRRENLVVKTVAQHCQKNRKMLTRNGKPCTSRYKGVCWEERTESWVAQISVDGSRRRIGRFRDEIAAAQAYDEAASEAWGEHARLNFPDGVDARLTREMPAREAA